MSKLDQLKALGDAKRAARKNTPEASGTARKTPSGLLLGRPNRGSARASTLAPIGDGIALTSMAHPPGLIDKLANAIRSGKLKVGRPKITARRPWEVAGISKRTWYRWKKREAEKAK